ncbi:hypothetical protein GOBAR_DD28001 [Gossypium barbadense]|nr:hypothetical protein GOBAR_DD28001 [Gossypium barbadense]
MRICLPNGDVEQHHPQSPRSPLLNFLGGGGGVVANGSESSIRKLVEENAVVVFGRRGCCMCHVVMRLLLGHGANPVVCEVEEGKEEAAIGKMFGGLDRVMSTHISGELVPVLKDAGALWL